MMKSWRMTERDENTAARTQGPLLCRARGAAARLGSVGSRPAATFQLPSTAVDVVTGRGRSADSDVQPAFPPPTLATSRAVMPDDKRETGFYVCHLLRLVAQRLLRWLTAEDDHRLERVEDTTELKRKRAD